MNIQQIYTKCLAQGAYYIESNGEAAIIDPLRDVSEYLKLAKEDNAKIKYVFETHFHADFVSGHLTIANLTGAQIVYGPNADPTFPSIIAEDNQVFKIGDISLTTIHTPGHTLESTSYLLKDEQGKEYCIFTGDTLFLGDVGIPDVAQRYKGLSKEDLAGVLYDSINNRIKPLPDNILVYPAHGAGSACGKNMMKETVDTLKNQKIMNYSLNNSLSKEGFIKQLTDNLPEPPSYFPSNVKLNQQGYDDVSDILKRSKKPLKSSEFEILAKDEDTLVLDVREQNDFTKAFIPNSIFIGLSGGFAPWVGSVISDINQKILLVTETSKVEEAIIRLSRVGFDNVIGYLEGGIETWINDHKSTDSIERINADQLLELYNENQNIIDVRKPGEFSSEHIENAVSLPLDFIHDNISHYPSGKLFIHCAGGYRSIIAASILKSKGYHDLCDVIGGYNAISKTSIPKTDFVCPNS